MLGIEKKREKRCFQNVTKPLTMTQHTYVMLRIPSEVEKYFEWFEERKQNFEKRQTEKVK